MIDLNELSKMAYENAWKRAEHEPEIKVDTISTLKHCSGEVIEATEAFIRYNNHKAGINKACLAEELADIICCVLTICGKENLDIEYALTVCMDKNARRAERGKQDETC